MAWEFHSEKEKIIGKVIFEISRKNDVHNNYEVEIISKLYCPLPTVPYKLHILSHYGNKISKKIRKVFIG